MNNNIEKKQSDDSVEEKNLENEEISFMCFVATHPPKEKGKLFDYFEVKEEIFEISNSLFIEDKIVNGFKLAGKTLFNAGLFAGKLGVEIIKEIPAKLEEESKKNKK